MANGNLKFRVATPEDTARLQPLVHSGYRGEESRKGWTTEADLLTGERIDAAGLTAKITAPDGVVLIATVDEDEYGSPVSCCELCRRGDDLAYFGLFVVDPRRQAGGIGRRVLAYAEDYCRREWGARRLEMQVIWSRRELIECDRRPRSRVGSFSAGNQPPSPSGNRTYDKYTGAVFSPTNTAETPPAGPPGSPGTPGSTGGIPASRSAGSIGQPSGHHSHPPGGPPTTSGSAGIIERPSGTLPGYQRLPSGNGLPPFGSTGSIAQTPIHPSRRSSFNLPAPYIPPAHLASASNQIMSAFSGAGTGRPQSSSLYAQAPPRWTSHGLAFPHSASPHVYPRAQPPPHLRHTASTQHLPQAQVSVPVNTLSHVRFDIAQRRVVTGPPGAGIPSSASGGHIPQSASRSSILSLSSGGGHVDRLTLQHLVFVITALTPGSAANPDNGTGPWVDWESVHNHMSKDGCTYTIDELRDAWNTKVRGDMRAIENYQRSRKQLMATKQVDKRSKDGACDSPEKS
ncbi:hypothetical protein DL768_009614 [Monosporascus sp. mg162]|nr:hypothetical protein DL768_009614 [Monosporascus sp. mg162]